MSISIENADAYFAEDKHLFFADWNRYSEKQKAAAIAWAKGTVNDALSGTLSDADTTSADFPRHDAAVYEQAVYTLKACKVLPSAATPTPAELFPDKEKEGDSVDFADPYKLCRAAIMMLTRDAMKVQAVRA